MLTTFSRLNRQIIAALSLSTKQTSLNSIITGRPVSLETWRQIFSNNSASCKCRAPSTLNILDSLREGVSTCEAAPLFKLEFSVRASISVILIDNFLTVIITYPAHRLHQDQQVPRMGFGLLRPAGSHGDDLRKMFRGSAECWVTAVTTTQVPPASVSLAVKPLLH